MYMTVRDLISYAIEHRCLDSEITIEGWDAYGEETTFHPGVESLRSKHTNGYLKIYSDPVYQAMEEE